MAIGHLIYISDAARRMSPQDLEAIRVASANYNANHAITGVLFYSAGHFVQLLEGDPDEVRKLYEKIEQDPRHQHIRLLVERSAGARLFPGWDMGLLDLNQGTASDRRALDELVKLAGTGASRRDGTPIEMDILSRFCMMLPGA